MKKLTEKYKKLFSNVSACAAGCSMWWCKNRRTAVMAVIGFSLIILSLTGMASYHRGETRLRQKLQQVKGVENILPKVREKKETDIREEGIKEESGTVSGNAMEENTIAITYDWDSLVKVNSDIRGWLYLPDTSIDFPVVSTHDNDYYLDHDFWKEKRNTGCPFMDKDTGQWDFNRTIYAHNMGYASGPMFSPLLNYKDKDYFEGHSLLYYTECYGNTAAYQVMAVIKYDVKDTQDWDFRTRNHGDVESYNLWMERLSEYALYYIEPDQAPEEILTLSTCDRSEFGKGGRLVIVAGKCDPSGRPETAM